MSSEPMKFYDTSGCDPLASVQARAVLAKGKQLLAAPTADEPPLAPIPGCPAHKQTWLQFGLQLLYCSNALPSLPTAPPKAPATPNLAPPPSTTLESVATTPESTTMTATELNALCLQLEPISSRCTQHIPSRYRASYDEVRRSTVRLSSAPYEEKTTWEFGTGCVVASNGKEVTILTTSHGKNKQLPTNENITLHIRRDFEFGKCDRRALSLGSEFTAPHVDIIFDNPDADIALIKVPSNETFPSVTLNTNPPPYAQSNYPGSQSASTFFVPHHSGGFEKQLSVCTQRGLNLTAIKNTIPENERRANKRKNFCVNVVGQAGGGSSGAPILVMNPKKARVEVVGVHHGRREFTDHQTGTTHCLKSFSELRHLTEAEKIKLRRATEKRIVHEGL